MSLLLRPHHLDVGSHAVRYTVVSSILRATVWIKYSQFMRLHRVQVSCRDKLCSRRGRITNNLKSVNSLGIVVVRIECAITVDPSTSYPIRSTDAFESKLCACETSNEKNNVDKKKNIKMFLFIYGICWNLRCAQPSRAVDFLDRFFSSLFCYASIFWMSIPAWNENLALLWQTSTSPATEVSNKMSSVQYFFVVAVVFMPFCPVHLPTANSHDVRLVTRCCATMASKEEWTEKKNSIKNNRNNSI